MAAVAALTENPMKQDSSPKRPDPKRFEQRRIFEASAKMISHYKELSFLEQIELCRIWAMASMVWEGVTAPEEADEILEVLRARMHQDLSQMSSTEPVLHRDRHRINGHGNGKA
jgi:hypothetical protein